MNKTDIIYFIGDCHTSRIQEHYTKKDNLNFVFWGKASKKCYDLNFNEMSENHEISSGKEKQEFIGDGQLDFFAIKDNGIVFLWFGYVDIRTFLPKYKNASFVVENYINQIKEYFKTSSIYIIEPLPQFTEMMLKNVVISPYYTHEERLEQNKEFLKHLHIMCKNNDIPIIITQKEILECLGVRELTPSMTHKNAPHPVDGLKEEFNEKLFNLFKSKAEKILNNEN